jgi:hypothetical protein
MKRVSENALAKDLATAIAAIKHWFVASADWRPAAS